MTTTLTMGSSYLGTATTSGERRTVIEQARDKSPLGYI